MSLYDLLLSSNLSIEPEDLPLNPDGTLLQIKVLPPTVWPLSDAALAVCHNCRSYLHMNYTVSICPYLRNLANKLLYFLKVKRNLQKTRKNSTLHK